MTEKSIQRVDASSRRQWPYPHRRGLRLRSFAVLVTCVVYASLSTGSKARADETEGARLFREGRAHMLEGRFDLACREIAESQRLEPRVGTLLNLAVCHERQGKIGTAWVEYQKVLTAARADGNADRVRLAQQRIEALDPRVPWLTVAVSTETRPADLVVMLDGAPLEPVAFGKELPVDPGSHLVEARVGQTEIYEGAIALEEGQHQTVTVNVSPAPPPPEGEAQKVIVEPKTPPAATPPARKSGWLFQLGVLVGVVNTSTAQPRPLTNPSSVGLTKLSDRTSTTCSGLGCEYSMNDVSGAVVAPNLFLGYAFSTGFDLGVRILAGPRLGGGHVVAFGPSIALHASDALSFGLWPLLGEAESYGEAVVIPPAGYSWNGSRVSEKSPNTGGPGLGLEVALRIMKLPSGSLLIDSTPFFTAGSHGTSWTLPIGIRYRFD